MKKGNIIISLLFFFFSAFQGVYGQEILFSGEEGDALRSLLVRDYKPNRLLAFRDAKDTLYKRVYAINDTVHSIYVDHTIYLPNGVDPSVHLFMNGRDNGINAEHIFPKSKGAEFGNANANMYNLAPCRVIVNSTRASYPFGDIPDNQTQRWFYKTISQSSIPRDKDLFSEYRTGFFEPGEMVKGDVARAVFYFYTMYQEEANRADPDFFESMYTDLCTWNTLDPVDSLEMNRVKKIATYQENKINPFVIDPSLAHRLYGDRFGTSACELISDTKNTEIEAKIVLSPNPVHDFLHVETSVNSYSLKVFSIDGREIISIDNLESSNNIELGGLAAGVWVIKIYTPDYSIIEKIIKY